MAGGAVTKKMQGQSMMGLLRGGTYQAREAVFNVDGVVLFSEIVARDHHVRHLDPSGMKVGSSHDSNNTASVPCSLTSPRMIPGRMLANDH